MKAKELLEELKDVFQWSASDNAVGIVEDVINNYYNEEDEIDVNDVDFQDHIRDTVNDYFIYYDDAFNYIMDQNITDFEDAYNEWQVLNIYSIATFYLEVDVFDLLREIDEKF